MFQLVGNLEAVQRNAVFAVKLEIIFVTYVKNATEDSARIVVAAPPQHDLKTKRRTNAKNATKFSK